MWGRDDPARPDRSDREGPPLRAAEAGVGRARTEGPGGRPRSWRSRNELLRRQHIALEQASALKSQFLANMSHEFRTPLNAILGYTHMLLNNVTGQVTDPQRKKPVRASTPIARHLLALINDILDITRIEAGRMPLNATDVRAGRAVRRGPVRARADHQALQPGGDGEGPGAPCRRSRSDRQKVKQIVLNLLSNALKFTPAGSVTMTASYDGRGRAGGDRGQGHGASAFRKTIRSRCSKDFRPARFVARPAAYGGHRAGACRSAAAWRRFSAGTIELDSTARHRVDVHAAPAGEKGRRR